MINAALSSPVPARWITEDPTFFLVKVCQACNCLLPPVFLATTDGAVTNANMTSTSAQAHASAASAVEAEVSLASASVLQPQPSLPAQVFSSANIQPFVPTFMLPEARDAYPLCPAKMLLTSQILLHQDQGTSVAVLVKALRAWTWSLDTNWILEPVRGNGLCGFDKWESSPPVGRSTHRSPALHPRWVGCKVYRQE
jgi:hypothetical protein